MMNDSTKPKFWLQNSKVQNNREGWASWEFVWCLLMEKWTRRCLVYLEGWIDGGNPWSKGLGYVSTWSNYTE